MPFHEHPRNTARAAMMRDGHVAGVPNLATFQVDAQTEIGIIHVKKEFIVHSAEALEAPSRNHHEGTADNGYPRRLKQGSFFKTVQALEVRMIGK
jgi:hypothetical protein